MLRIMPETVQSPPLATLDDARARLSLPREGRLVGTAGVLDERKGADLLVRAFARAAASGRLRRDDRLLLMGEQSPGVRRLIHDLQSNSTGRERILVFDRVVTDDELAYGLAAMDVVATPYPRHIGSASIVIRAAAAGRPVLGSSYGWIGYMVPRFDLGWTTDVLDEERFAAALGEALDRSDTYALSAAGHRFVRYNTPENHRAAWTELIRQRLGLPPAPFRLTWSWALGDRPD
jgi:glycosyltransferase involved in cell wall biosynthesis